MSSRVKQLYEFGPFRLDPAEHTLLRDGRPIPLRPKVFDILLVLVENRGHLVNKEQLMNSVWTEQFVEEGNINKNISMLRQALGESDSGYKFIETVPKRGYRFVADVREVNDNRNTELAEEDGHEYPTSASPNTQTRTKSFNRNLIALFVVTLVISAALLYVGFIRKRRSPVTPAVASIAVLPFQNLSGDSG